MFKIKKRNRSMAMNVNPSQSYESQSYAEFAKMRVGAKTLDDAILNIGTLKKTNRRLTDKDAILRAINESDYAFMREVSNFFYESSGIYGRLCRYIAYLYRYDWYVTPYINNDKIKGDKILTEFNKVLNYVDALAIKKNSGDIALKVCKNGAYYGYIVDNGTRAVFQELPVPYCRSRYFSNGRPVVEFNVKFFDDNFRDVGARMNVLKSFPKEFQKAYVAYKEGRLVAEPGDEKGWVLLDPTYAFKISLNNSEMPMMASVIPAIIDLDEAQDLDKKKMLQELLKIVIQKMPLDKNGELIFDVDEAMDLHNNAVQMLGKAIGVDILTTFADIEVANLSDRNSSTTKDDLQKVERAVYNEAGISQMLFATDGNLALEKSIANDEASIYNLVLQLEEIYNHLIDINFNKNPKKYSFKLSMLTTTIYNYRELAKMYKEQATLGYSKMLPQIALGQTQSSILATAYFENEILKLSEIMQPLQSSNTQSAADKKDSKDNANQQPKGEEKKAGRKEKPDDEKSEKTIQNKESMS